MSTNETQLGFRLPIEDRNWFVSECQKNNTSAATILGNFIKHCRVTKNIPTFGFSGQTEYPNVRNIVKEEMGLFLTDITTSGMTELLEKIEALEPRIEALEKPFDIKIDSSKKKPMLSDTQREEIKELYQSKEYTMDHLAKQFGVNTSTISRVIKPK